MFGQPVEVAGGGSSRLSLASKDLYALSVSMADLMRWIISCQSAIDRILNGMSPTYDQSIIDHALYVRTQRDEKSRATTSRDTEA